MRSLGMAASVGRNTVSLNVPDFLGLAGSGVGWLRGGDRRRMSWSTGFVKDMTGRAPRAARVVVFAILRRTDRANSAAPPEWVSSLGGPDADAALARIFFNVVRRLMRLSPERRA